MYSEESKHLLDQIIENRFKDIPLQMKLCDQLCILGQSEHNDDIIATSYFYRAEALFSENPSESETFANKCLSMPGKGNNTEILARTYNLLGILAYNRDDLSLALDHFLSCFNLCKENGFSHIEGLCACNLGVIFQLLEAYEKAIPYYQSAMKCFEGNSDQQFSLENITSVYSNLFICYSKLDDAENCCTCLEFMRRNSEFLEPCFALDFYEVEYAYLIHSTSQIHQNIVFTVEKALHQENLLEFIDTYQLLCEFLYRLEEFDLLKTLLDLIDSEIDEQVFPGIRINLLKYRLKCIEAKQDWEQYLACSNKFIHTYDTITENYHRSIMESVNLRFRVEELRKEELLYEMQSRTDELTRVYNRSGFHHFAEPLLQKAVKHQVPIGFSIIDVDYFKDINDRYGHTAGDNCLKQIADILTGFQDKDTIVSRYGGDEFILFTYGKEQYEIEKIASAIKEQIAQLKIPNEKSAVSDFLTLSQGIHCAVPAPQESLLDYMHKADKALYIVKRKGRNGFRFFEDAM